jgi:DNA-binding MarR family transcriptional regulator
MTQKLHPVSTSNDTPSEAAVTAWARLMRAQKLMLAVIERDLKAAKLPPLVWYDVLLETERAGEGGIRPVALEKVMLLAQYNLSRLLDRIEAEGLIARAPCVADGRGQVVVITKAGRALRHAMWPVYASAIEKAFGRHMDRSEALQLTGLLGRMVVGNS